MFKQKENRINFLGSAVFAFLIFLVIVAFAEKQDHGVDAGTDLKNTVGLYLNPAVIVEVQQFIFLKSLTQPADYLRFKQLEDLPKLISQNNVIHHTIIFRERTGFLIRPVIVHVLYNLYHACDTDDLPPLS